MVYISIIDVNQSVVGFIKLSIIWFHLFLASRSTIN